MIVKARGKIRQKTEKKKQNRTKTGQGTRSSRLGIHPFISSHREPAETASSVPLNGWENIDLKRLGN